jgi:NTP pyrophosphatase (non-canonical NTP hydrolase)
MMNVHQFWLLKLAEESAEVAQRCSKQMLFGHDEREGGIARPNHERLREELIDLMMCVKLCERLGIIYPIAYEDLQHQWRDKLPKVRAMTWLAVEQGQLDPRALDLIPTKL